MPDVVDSREHADPVMRGVSVFIPEAKTGRRQAVRVEDAEIAVLLVAWRDAVELSEGPDARLFPPAARLRSSDLAEALAPFRVEARGLHFTFHSFRHGGASRAYLAGSDTADILLRGRWKVESSGKHYIQAGRQLLNGAQAEQLVRHLPDPKGVSQRRQRQDIFVSAVIEQVKAPSGIGVIPDLVAQLDAELETNLSRTEQLSLAAAIIASPEPVAISRLPLADRAGEQTLRQIKPDVSRPLWPQL